MRVLVPRNKRRCSTVFKGFPSGSSAKNLPAQQEKWVWSLDQEDPLEKEMATHSSILAWEIPWTEKPARLQSMGHKESDTTEQLYFDFGIALLLLLLLLSRFSSV